MPTRSPVRWWPAFALLFAAYQAPEGLAARWLGQPALAAALMLAFLPLAWAVARRLGLGMAAAYALEWRPQATRWLLGGLALALAAKAAALAAGLQLGVYAAADQAPTTAAALAGTLAWLALATFVPSLAEDLLTRGFWARVPGWRWRGLAYVLFTTTLYVLNHVYRLANGPAEWLMLACFGLAYAAAAWRSGSLWAAVGLHWGWNFAGQALALGWPTQVLAPAQARGLSAGAHLLLLGVVLLWPQARAPLTAAPGPAQPA